MSFQITDARREETDSFLALPYVSPDGNFAYVVYEIVATETSRKGAELFRITGGQFVSLAVYTVEEGSPFISIDAGGASHDFTRFSIVEDNQQPGNAGLMRVRLLEYNGTGGFQVVAERIFSAYVIGFTPYGGVFLENDAALVVTAVTTNTTPNQTSTVWVLENSSTLNAIATYTDQVVYTTIAATFAIAGRQYFAITASRGVLDFNDAPKAWQAPHELRIFRVSRNGRLLIEQTAYLPQGGLSVTALENRKHVLISVGTYAALPSNNDNTIPIRIPENTAANDADTSELRFYKFRPGRLALCGSQNTDSTVDSVFVTPRYLFVSQNTGPYEFFLPSFFDITSRCDCCHVHIARPSNSSPLFATDARESIYLMASASDERNLNNNLILFRIVC